MSVIVISSDSPTFECQSPACYIDAESIDTSYVYDSEYISSCSTNPTITVIGGGEDGVDGSDGSDGRGISSIAWTSNSGGGSQGDPGTIDTYTITYTDATTSTFQVTNGSNGADGAVGETGDTGPQGDPGVDGTDGTDGATILTGAVAPTGGNNDDLYFNTVTYDLYKKVAGLWGSPIANLKGTTGDAGADGSDGSDGDQWSYGSGVPSDATVLTYDLYYLNIDNGDVYIKEATTDNWGSGPIANINGDQYKTSSTTPINLDTTSVDGPLVLTVDSGLSYTVGQFVVVAYDADNQLTGKVTAYSTTSLTITVTYLTGTGTYADWDINLAGLVEAGRVPGWYTITATAGTGSIASRVFTAPSGWTVDAATNITNADLPTATTKHLRIEHNTGLYAVDTVVYVDEGTYNTKVTGTRAYGTMYEDSSHTTIQLNSFCTETAALIIHIKLQ